MTVTWMLAMCSAAGRAGSSRRPVCVATTTGDSAGLRFGGAGAVTGTAAECGGLEGAGWAAAAIDILERRSSAFSAAGGSIAVRGSGATVVRGAAGTGAGGVWAESDSRTGLVA